MPSSPTHVAPDALVGLLRRGFLEAGLREDQAEYIARDLVAAEVAGKSTHGIIKYHDVVAAIERRGGSPHVEVNGPVAFVDGRRELGHLIARRMVDVAMQLVASHGVAVVGARNFSYYARLAEYVRQAAAAGFVSMMLNSAGPPAIVPFGGCKPVLGTNPIAFGLPRDGRDPVVIDLASAAEVWGHIALARASGDGLPADAFVDKNGAPTTNPDAVAGVLPFGGAKGYALAFAIEVLGGALMGMPTGTRVGDEYDLGALLLLIDPDCFGGSAFFATEVGRLSSDVSDAGGSRVPGDRLSVTTPSAEARLAVDLAVLQGLHEVINNYPEVPVGMSWHGNMEGPSHD